MVVLVSPAAVLPAVVDRLHANLKAIVMAPTTQQKLIELGVIPIDTPPVPTLRACEARNWAWGKEVEHASLAGSE
jgi:hypothetical protein